VRKQQTSDREKEVIAVTTPLFKLGQVLATPGAIDALEQAGQNVWEFLSRHIAGDWGVVDADDKAANDQSLKDGSRLLSAYMLNDEKTKVWIITEAEDDDGNRAATTLLMPSEY
jgi:hypothetical protein